MVSLCSANVYLLCGCVSPSSVCGVKHMISMVAFYFVFLCVMVGSSNCMNLYVFSFAEVFVFVFCGCVSLSSMWVQAATVCICVFIC